MGNTNSQKKAEIAENEKNEEIEENGKNAEIVDNGKMPKLKNMKKMLKSQKMEKMQKSRKISRSQHLYRRVASSKSSRKFREVGRSSHDHIAMHCPFSSPNLLLYSLHFLPLVIF